jgi:hypothetical protein
MKTVKPFVLAVAVTVAYFPLSAGAFGFGASKQEYPGQWGPYGPPPQGRTQPRYAPMPYAPSPYGPPPYARDVKGMWGSGPGMSWGSRDRGKPTEPPAPKWKWTKDWHYESPYRNAPPWVSPYAAPLGKPPAK